MAILYCIFLASKSLVLSHSEYFSHVGVEETPLALCKRPDFYFWQVDKELVFAGAVVGHPVFSATFDRNRMLAMSPEWIHTVPYPGRPPWRSVVVRPPVEKFSSAL